MKYVVHGALMALTALSAATAASAAERTQVALQPRAYRTWDLLLPAERFAEVGAGFAVAHQGGARFAAQVEGKRLRADLDGNGEFEALVEGEEGFLTFSGTSAEGHPLGYSVRVVQPQGKPWMYSCGGAMVGEIAGTKVQIIDQNLNGEFDDVGEDALVIGRDNAASFLSDVVSIGGALYSLQVARDGATLSYEPFTGAAGTLDLLAGFEGKAKLQAAIVVSADGARSFSLAKARGGLRVPAGEYKLHSGQLVLGDARAHIATGRAAPITVAADAAQVVAWGGPVRAEFAYERNGGQVGFTPWDIWFYGRLGEQYSNFLPLGKSPDFVIKEKNTGDVLVTARFPGNC